MSPKVRAGLLATGIVGVLFLLPLGALCYILAGRANDGAQSGQTKISGQNSEPQKGRTIASDMSKFSASKPVVPERSESKPKVPDPLEIKSRPPIIKTIVEWDLDDVVVAVRRGVSPSLKVLERSSENGSKWILALGDDGVGFAVFDCSSDNAASNLATQVKNGWSWRQFCFSFCVNSDVESANRVIKALDPSGVRFTQFAPTFSEEIKKIAESGEAKRKELAKQAIEKRDRQQRAEKSRVDEILQQGRDPNEEKQGLNAKDLRNHQWWSKPLGEKVFESLVEAIQESDGDTQIWFDRDGWFVAKEYATRAPQDRRLEKKYPEFNDRVSRGVDMVLVFKRSNGVTRRELALGQVFAALERGVKKLGPAGH